jgi:hypothetical protein
MEQVAEEMALLARVEHSKHRHGEDPSESDRQGLRLDSTVTDLATGKRYWLDVMCVHPTCKSYIAAESAATQRRRAPAGQAREGVAMQGRGESRQGREGQACALFAAAHGRLQAGS